MRESVLLVDVGNSRVKWAVHDGDHQYIVRGAVGVEHIDELSRVWSQHTVARMVGICVAADEIRDRVANACGGISVAWLKSTVSQAGVVNRYGEPSRLGADRWAALIGARHRARGAWVVVNAGTAVTVDALSDSGEFLGGMILPGLRLMFDALVTRTAGLRVEPGSYVAFPIQTPDAMTTGAIDAVIGAAERMYRRLAARDGNVKLLLSGGAAEALAPHMTLACEKTENIVLDGLVIVAKETTK